MPSKTTGDSLVIDVGIGIVVRQAPNNIQKFGTEPGLANEVLITRRPSSTVFAGWWEFPGGKVHPGEDVPACIRRELREEVGIEVVVGEALASVEHRYPHGHVRLHPMLCGLSPGSPAPRNLHVAEHRWCLVAELGRFSFPPANDSIMAALHRALNRR